MNNQSDHIQDFARRISKGEEQALTELYRLAYPVLYRYGLRIIDSHEAAIVEEVLSDFFLWVAKNHQKIGKISNFEGYMYRAVRQNINQALLARRNKLKKQQRFQQRTEPLNDVYEPSPEQILIGQELELEEQNQIRQAIDQLPIYQKEALHLRYYEERDYTEIAALLNTNPQVVRNYVSRAVKSLRKHLSRLHFIFL